MMHASAIAESIVAPMLFRLEFLHSLGHDPPLTLLQGPLLGLERSRGAPPGRAELAGDSHCHW